MFSSMFSSGDPEETVSCPYNKAHQIIRKRMQTHLVKCSKNYQDTNLQVCIYNAVHKVPEPEMKFHLETCPDRHKIDKYYYRKETDDSASSNRFPIVNTEVPQDECWDDINVPSYDPVKKCESTPVLRQLNVESAAKKRNFRYEERQRIQALSHVKQEISKVEKATDFAQREGPSSRPAPSMMDVDENDPFQVSTMMERIRMGAIPVRLMESKARAQLDETDTDNPTSDAESFETGGFQPKKGCGRGRFIAKGRNK